MPCFKGLAVSIHTPDGPLPEYGIQKHSRTSRVSAYIPVPPAKVPMNSTTGKPEQSTFAVSITLLVPGLPIPYSTPNSNSDGLWQQPRYVGGLPDCGEERGKYTSSVQPFMPSTKNPNETIAAYIYFDGRAKEEVATLLRRGEETWVNSRWVSVPASEGGGLAEREFLFREVGLERWLNGLDLDNKKVNKAERAERLERRQKRVEKQRRKRSEAMNRNDDGEALGGDETIRLGANGESPEAAFGEHDGLFLSNSDSEDEPPQPEAAGQIKIALFRVLASGEIKRGEYSPQFDAHDDDDENGESGATNGDAGCEDVDHTTSFAKPKSLDPKSISTQTVTGLDPPESPYAVFTFFYRGEAQLRKMNILPEADATPASSRRKSAGPDFANLGPLKTTGTKGFSGYRDSAQTKRKSKDKRDDDMDSDADDEDEEVHTKNTGEEAEEKQNGSALLSPDDAKRQGEIADGVSKMKLKRIHSAEPLVEPASLRKSPHLDNRDSPAGDSVVSAVSVTAVAGTPPNGGSPMHNDVPSSIGSPFKRHRASVANISSSLFGLNGDSAAPGSLDGVQQTDSQPFSGVVSPDANLDVDEEL